MTKHWWLCDDCADELKAPLQADDYDVGVCEECGSADEIIGLYPLEESRD